MTKTLGVGIIGCGNISTTYLTLAPLFKGIEIRAVADLDMAAAQARATDYGVIAQSVAELLRNDDIQIVVNLTVPAAHFKVSRAILEAGKLFLVVTSSRGFMRGTPIPYHQDEVLEVVDFVG